MLSDRSPKMITWLSLAGAGAGLAWWGGRVGADLHGLAEIGAALLLFAALLALVNWLSYQVGQRIKEQIEARSYTERVRVLQEVGRLSVEQVRLLELNTPVISVLAGEPEPCYYLRVGGGEVPFQFISRFLELSDRQYLCPVSTWAEGTKNREWAVLLTSHLVLMGFAAPGRGNRPATWNDQARALRWMGITE